MVSAEFLRNVPNHKIFSFMYQYNHIFVVLLYRLAAGTVPTISELPDSKISSIPQYKLSDYIQFLFNLPLKLDEAAIAANKAANEVKEAATASLMKAKECLRTVQSGECFVLIQYNRPFISSI